MKKFRINGDSFIAMYPNAEVFDRTCYDNEVDIVIDGKTYIFDSDWWFAPFGKEEVNE